MLPIAASPLPTFEYERDFGRDVGFPIAGVDEAGRGAWCGPVVAAAVIFPDADHIPGGLNDSKKLTERRREALALHIRAHAVIGIGAAEATEVDALGVGKATYLAMARAISALSQVPAGALVDGNIAPNLGTLPVRTLVRGDSRSLSVAAASIIAKTHRDAIMRRLASDYPGFGWERNKGYGAQAHAEALQSRGVTAQHRKSFAPIRALIEAAHR